MEYRRIKYFEMVARTGNITKAAEKLKMAQPPLSQQIRILEKELGVKLFERHKQGMFLTSEGFLFLERVTPLIKQFDGLTTFMSGINNQSIGGKLTVATLTAYSGILGEALFHFWHAHPDVCLFIREGVSERVLKYMDDKKAQIGITRLPIMNTALNYTMLGNDTIRVFLRDDDPLAHKELILPKDLKNRLLLLIHSNTEHSGFTRIAQILEEAGTRPRIVCYADTVVTLLQLIRRKMGIGLLTNSAVTYMQPGIKMIPFCETDINIPTAVVWQKGEANPLVIEAKNLIVKYCSSEGKASARATRNV